LAKAGKVTMRTTSHREEPIAVVFNLSGLTKILKDSKFFGDE